MKKCALIIGLYLYLSDSFKILSIFLNEKIAKDKKIKKVIFFFNLKFKLSLLSMKILKGTKIDNAISAKPPYLNAG